MANRRTNSILSLKVRRLREKIGKPFHKNQRYLDLFIEWRTDKQIPYFLSKSTQLDRKQRNMSWKSKIFGFVYRWANRFNQSPPKASTAIKHANHLRKSKIFGIVYRWAKRQTNPILSLKVCRLREKTDRHFVKIKYIRICL